MFGVSTSSFSHKDEGRSVSFKTFIYATFPSSIFDFNQNHNQTTHQVILLQIVRCSTTKQQNNKTTNQPIIPHILSNKQNGRNITNGLQHNVLRKRPPALHERPTLPLRHIHPRQILPIPCTSHEQNYSSQIPYSSFSTLCCHFMHSLGMEAYL